MTDVRVKMADLRVKSAGPEDGLGEGEFIAYASVFGNVDSYGDVVQDSAFDRTLSEWSAKGDTIPVLWGHDMWDPFNNIGGVKEATIIKQSEEKADGEKAGFKVHAQLDLENPTAAQVYRLVKGRRTTKMSFAYAVKDGTENDHGGLDLKDVDLFEVSVVQVPANEEAEILAVKSAATRLIKAGRVLSSKNETALRQARDAIDSVLVALDSQSESGGEEDGKQGTQQQQASGSSTTANGGASAEDPATGNASVSPEEPKSAPSVEAWDTEFSFYATAFAGKD
jgi:HK97 family phage prohead protease